MREKLVARIKIDKPGYELNKTIKNYIRSSRFRLRYSQGDTRGLFNVLDEPDEYDFKIGRHLERVSEAYYNLTNGELVSMVLELNTNIDARAEHIYVQLNKDDKDFDTFFIKYYNYDQNILSGCAYEFIAEGELRNILLDNREIQFIGLSSFDISDPREKDVGFCLSNEKIKNVELENKARMTLLYKMGDYKHQPSDVQILSYSFMGSATLNDIRLDEISYMIDGVEYVYSISRDMYGEMDKNEVVDDCVQDSKLMAYIINTGIESFLHYYEENEIGNTFKKNHLLASFEAAFAGKFEDVAYNRESGTAIFKNHEDDLLFKIDGDVIKVKKEIGLDVYSEFRLSEINDNFSSILARIENLAKSPSASLKKWLGEVRDLAKISDPIRAYESAKEIIEELPDYEEVARSVTELQEGVKIIKNIFAKFEKIDIEKIKHIIAKFNEYITHYDEMEEDVRVRFKEEIYDEYTDLQEEEIKAVENEYTKFSDFILENDFKNEEIVGFRRVFIHKNAKKEYESFDKKVKDAITEIVKNMKTLNGRDLLDYFVKTLRMNAPHNHENYKVRVKNIQPYRIWFWYGHSLIGRESCQNDIYIWHFTSTQHDADIEKSRDVK